MNRTACNVGTWRPTPTEWSAAVAALREVEPEEAARVERFRFAEDRKRALAGRLLARAAVVRGTGAAWRDVALRRTEANKPYAALREGVDPPRFNFNVSHHGDWVAVASHDRLRVGVDVMRFDDPPRGEAAFMESFASYFTPHEWSQIRGADAPMRRFYEFWALKESYIKAVGVGLGFPLQRISFTRAPPHLATAAVDGRELADWHFDLGRLDERHCVAVALGSDADEGPTREDRELHGSAAGARFREVAVQDLLRLAG